MNIGTLRDSSYILYPTSKRISIRSEDYSYCILTKKTTTNKQKRKGKRKLAFIFPVCPWLLAVSTHCKAFSQKVYLSYFLLSSLAAF